MSESLEQLAGFYEKEIAKKVKKSKQGLSAYGDESYLVNKEYDIAHDSRIYTKQDRWEARREILAGQLYDRLQSVEPSVLQEIAAKVRDPLLDQALIWLATHGGIEQSDEILFKQEFQNKQRVPQRNLQVYFRPLILLDLVKEHPQIVEDLNESSSYFPHAPFKPPKAPTMKDLARDISIVLPTLYDEDLVTRVAQIDNWIKRGFSVGRHRKAGKYLIPESLNLYFQISDDLENQLDLAFNNQEIKKRIYETLATVYQLVSSKAWKAGKYLKNSNRKGFPYGVAKTEYKYTLEALQNYAANQIIKVWKETDGEVIPQTHLSRLVRVSAKPMQEGLEISTPIVKYQIGTSIEIDGKIFHTPMRNSTQYLPLCVWTLNKMYKAAGKINEENT